MAAQLHRCLDQTNSLSELNKQLNQILLSYTGNYTLSNELLLSVDTLLRGHGSVSVALLSEQSHYSTRHLNRIFLNQIGISIKTFARLIRLEHTLQLLGSGAYELTELALQNGYCDQSHFIRDFKKLCGITPNTFLANMSDFSYTEGLTAGYYEEKY